MKSDYPLRSINSLINEFQKDVHDGDEKFL